jgi:hypothetical protein
MSTIQMEAEIVFVHLHLTTINKLMPPAIGSDIDPKNLIQIRAKMFLDGISRAV